MIGIYGGTFDPVHNGHLQVVKALTATVEFDELRLLPCGEPAHRAPPAASAKARVAMLQLATAAWPLVSIDEREVQRKGPSYMVDTLASLREEQGDTPLVLIIGWDAFVTVPNWHRWQQLMTLAHLLVVQRPGNRTLPCGEIESLLQQHQVASVAELKQHDVGCILLQPIDLLELSSTQVKAAIAAKQDVSEMLPAAVNVYIKKHNLYLSEIGKS